MDHHSSNGLEGLWKLTLLALVAPLLTAFATAQNNPKFEVFGGYSLERISACGAPQNMNYIFLPCSMIEDGFSTPAPYNGWTASLTHFVYKFVGVTADFAGHYGTTTESGDGRASAFTSRYSYMVGPVAAFRAKNSGTLFAHALFGGVSNNFGNVPGGGFHSNNPNYTLFAWAVGGGLDLNATPLLAVRLFQLDYERVNVPSGAEPAVAGFRYATGVVFKF
jgi:hypothetical protein